VFLVASVGVVGVFLGVNTSKQNVRHGRAFSTAAAQLGDFRAASGRRSECHLRWWLGGMYGLWAPPFVRWAIYFPLGALSLALYISPPSGWPVLAIDWIYLFSSTGRRCCTSASSSSCTWASCGGGRGRSAAVTMSATYPSPSGVISSGLLPWSNARGTSAGSCAAGTSGGEFGGGALRLEEPGIGYRPCLVY
jgi:hypothetical protein